MKKKYLENTPMGGFLLVFALLCTFLTDQGIALTCTEDYCDEDCCKDGCDCSICGGNCIQCIDAGECGWTKQKSEHKSSK